MRIVKYIISDSGIPFLFNTDVNHADVLTSAVSAGYAIISYDKLIDTFSVKCYGGSESLKIKNVDKKDCFIIQDYLNSL